MPLRPEWAGDIRLTLQWCPCDPAILDAVQRVIAPGKVLIHVPGWRTDAYDENYPQYTASPVGREFITQATQRGFRVLPHFNYCTVDPTHPLFGRVGPYVMRDIRTKALMGWRWSGHRLPFPQSHSGLVAHRAQKTMAYIHAGLSIWRRELVERVAAAMRDLGIAGAFVDQTLVTCNLDNALFENLNSTQGMVALTRELCQLDGRPAIGGEGINEMSMRYTSFAQAHLFKSWHRNHELLERLEPVPMGAFLYGDLCRPMGYAGLDGTGPEGKLRLSLHERLGALPSLTIRRPEQIERPNPAVKRVLERALS